MAIETSPGAIGVAAAVATAGLWWFAYMLKGLRRLSPVTRYGLYAAIWLAYFILVLILAAQSRGAD